MGETKEPYWANDETAKVYAFFSGNPHAEDIEWTVLDRMVEVRDRGSVAAWLTTDELRRREEDLHLCAQLGVDPGRVNWGAVSYHLVDGWKAIPSATSSSALSPETPEADLVRGDKAGGRDAEDPVGVAWRWVAAMETPQCQAAVRQLVLIGAQAAAPLIWAACGKSSFDWAPETRWAAVRALHMIGPTAIKGFLNSLRDREYEGYYHQHSDIAALTFLVQEKLARPDRVVPLLSEYLQFAGEVRGAAAYALGDLGSPLAVPELLYSLEDYAPERWEGMADDPEEPDACRALLRALGQLRDARAVEPLASFLDHPDEDVLDSAASALHHIGGPAREAIHTAGARALADLGSQDPARVRRALAVLGGLGGPDCARAVAARTSDPDTSIRERAVETLCRLPGGEHDDAVTEILLSALRDLDDRVRRTAARGLRVQKERLDARIESVRARLQVPVEGARRMVLKPVVDALEDDVPQVRTNALTMVMRQGVGFAADILIEALARSEALPSHLRADRDVDRALIRSWLADHGIPLNDGEEREEA